MHHNGSFKFPQRFSIIWSVHSGRRLMNTKSRSSVGFPPYDSSQPHTQENSNKPVVMWRQVAVIDRHRSTVRSGSPDVCRRWTSATADSRFLMLPLAALNQIHSAHLTRIFCDAQTRVGRAWSQDGERGDTSKTVHCATSSSESE